MNRLILLSALLAACAETPDPVSEASFDYAGPPVHAVREGDRMQVAVRVPTAGYRFVLASSRNAQGVGVYRFRLTAPPEGAVVAQVVETKSLEVALVDAGTAHVEIQQVQEGAHYLVEPEFVLAAVLEPR